VDKVALGQDSYEYFGSFCQLLQRLIHNGHHSPSGAGTLGKALAGVLSVVSPTLAQEKKITQLKFPT
jgi:hypothetical protein